MPAKKATITGASGMIGSHLSRQLLANGWDVVGLTRNPEKARRDKNPDINWQKWDGKTASGWLEAAEGSSAIINLAGEDIAGGRWTDGFKKRILDSRVNAGRAVSEAINQMSSPPALVLQASAIGFYGSRGDEELDESAASGDGFLSDVVRQWEGSVEDIKDGVAVKYLRIGVVLSTAGGMLAKLMLPYQMFVGGPAGSGKQWLSWVHIDDVINIMHYIVDKNPTATVFNLTAPNPVKMEQFSDAFAASLSRPSWLPVPSFAIKLLFGEMGESTVLASTRAVPNQLEVAGYQFKYPSLQEALAELTGSDQSQSG